MTPAQAFDSGAPADDALLERLQRLDAELAGICEQLAGAGDAGIVQAATLIESIGRKIDASRVRSAGEIALRSDKSLGADRLSARLGCRNEVELLQRITRRSHGQLKRRIGLDESTRPAIGITGARIAPRFPRIAGALHRGQIDPETADLVAGMLTKVAHRADPAQLVAAEAELVDAATGALASRLVAENNSAGAGPEPAADPESADPTVDPADESAAGEAAQDGEPDPMLALVYPEMRKLAAHWEASLDQDGPVPAEEQAQRRRMLTIGAAKDGLVSVRALLLPEVAAQLQVLLDAHLNPAARANSIGGTPADGADAGVPDFLPADTDLSAVQGIGPDQPVLDDRTAAQRRHDVLMSVLQAAARSAETPNLGGDAATLLVHVNAQDLADPDGYAQIEGFDAPVSARLAHRIACTGAVQKVVFDRAGRIVGLGSKERVFTSHQRRAITARDGGCVIPGCMIPASWCEIHHVIPWARGGPTHTDNGALLCFFHHRSIEDSGWQIQMRSGVVYVKAPEWIDPAEVFRPAQTSQSRQLAGRLLANTAPTARTANGGGSPGGGKRCDGGDEGARGGGRDRGGAHGGPAMPLVVARGRRECRIRLSPTNSGNRGRTPRPIAPHPVGQFQPA
ncbi:hypothetical protein BJH93_06490 [Kocuria polaris]|nr:hypothetical protein [Kocuria polaris]